MTTPPTSLRVAALIPAFNEAETIASVINGLTASVDHVIVVDDGSTDGTAERSREAGAEVVRHERNLGKGHAVRTGLARVIADREFTHVLLIDGDMQHLPGEATRLIDAARASSADVVIGERVFQRSAMPASRYHANRIGSRVLSWFVGVPLDDTQCGFRIFRAEILRGLPLSATGYEIETEMLVKVRRRGGRVVGVPVTAVYAGQKSKLVRSVTRHAPVFWRCTIDSLNASDPVSQPTVTPAAARDADVVVPRRWTLHGLNNGVIFGATCRGVSVLPRGVSYAIGDVSTWIAWRLMQRTRSAIADNLRAIFPEEASHLLERRARLTLRSYARDVIDFLRALQLSKAGATALFDYTIEDARLFETLLAQGRGIILVSGHYGNWELGGVAMRRVFDLPLTVVAMAEASEEVNRLRRDIREDLGIDTVEVRRSLDTALQIRKRLADNRIVALLMDRHLGRDRVQVNFFGRPTWFLRTPALMAALSGAPIVPCFIERIDGGRFSVRPGEPIWVATDRPRDQAIQLAAQQFADQLEVRIRRQPQYWYHFYRYWDAQDDSYDRLS